MWRTSPGLQPSIRRAVEEPLPSLNVVGASSALAGWPARHTASCMYIPLSLLSDSSTLLQECLFLFPYGRLQCHFPAKLLATQLVVLGTSNTLRPLGWSGEGDRTS